jgi:hypothetical protein
VKKAWVIKQFGGVRATARALGIDPAAVSRWGEDIPRMRVYQVRYVLERRRQSTRVDS